MTEEVPFVVSPEWLAGNLDRVRVVDVREPWEFESIGHVPGAVSIPFDSFRVGGEDDRDGQGSDDGSADQPSADEGMLPGAERFGSLLGDAGIAPGDAVVAYDDEHGVFAARFVVTALLYGHEDVHLLDGDYSAWSRDHGVTTDPTDVEPVEYRATVPEDRPLVDAAAVEAAVDDPDAVLVDTRSREEFEDGHIAGAVHLDWRELVDPESRGLKSSDELLDLFEEHGVVVEKRVVLYCNTARRISHTYLALRDVGFEDVDFYEGSLTDWRARGLELVSGS